MNGSYPFCAKELTSCKTDDTIAREVKGLNRILADWVLVLVTFVWGATFIVVQDAIRDIPVFAFLAIRFLSAGVILLFAALLLKRGQAALRMISMWKSGLILGFWLFAGYAFQTLGLMYTTAAKSGLITGLCVALVPVFSIFLLRHTPPRGAFIGVGIALVGLFLLSGIRTGSVNIGDLLTLFCAISFAIQIVLMAKHARENDPLALAAVQILFVGILSEISSLLLRESPQRITASLSVPTVWIALLICSLLATVIAYFAQAAFQRYTTATKTALIFSLEPVFAALVAVWYGGESLTLTSIFGGILIVAGMLTAEFSGQERAQSRKKRDTHSGNKTSL